ncbi:MAG TPA: pyridoxal-phosphate dependent enzyme [Vicinamibacterales bacterium]
MTQVEHSRLVCAGCGAEAIEPYSFRCPRATTDDVDHVLSRALDLGSLHFPDGDDPNPFVRYRTLLRSYHVARAYGMADAQFVTLARDFNDAVAHVDGRGFTLTPFARDPWLSDALGFTSQGGLWVKDETGNVSGSHKGRHLAGIMLYLLVIERLGLVQPPLPPLAIASCGNAALAAAVVARAAERRLLVFIPTDAPASIVERLHALGACVNVCTRAPGIGGDPCYHAFREAVSRGALPFCCQGNENGLTIEGGETLGYEVLSQLRGRRLDRFVIQAGGGALASAVIQSFTEGVALGATPRLPRFDVVQTAGAFPLKRAYDLVSRRASSSPGDSLRYAAAHRGAFMWPWETPPRSIAHGILDDETYDWHAVVEGMFASGGSPIVVTDDELCAAHDLAAAAPRRAIEADHTGTAGLAGVMQLAAARAIHPDERVAVIFSGARRD